MSKLKAFDVVLGQYCEDGSPCVVAFATGRTPRALNEKIYLKSEADAVIAHQKYKRCLAMAKLAIKDDYLPWNMKWHKHKGFVSLRMIDL